MGTPRSLGDRKLILAYGAGVQAPGESLPSLHDSEISPGLLHFYMYYIRPSRSLIVSIGVG